MEQVFEKPGVTAYNIPTYFDGTILFLDVHGGHDTYCKFHGGDQLFICKNGEGTFEIEDNIIPIKENMHIIVPKGATYTYTGHFQMYQVQIPSPDLSLFEDIKINEKSERTITK